MPQLATITMNGTDFTAGTDITRTLNRELSLVDGVVLRESGATAADLADAGVVRFRTKTASSKDGVSRLSMSYTKPFFPVGSTVRKAATCHFEVVFPSDTPANVRKEIRRALSGYTGGTNFTNWVDSRDNPV